jgi:hypothetical protein
MHASILLTYTGLRGELEHLKIETRLIDERFCVLVRILLCCQIHISKGLAESAAAGAKVWLRKKPMDLCAWESEEHEHGVGAGANTTLHLICFVQVLLVYGWQVIQFQEAFTVAHLQLC